MSGVLGSLSSFTTIPRPSTTDIRQGNNPEIDWQTTAIKVATCATVKVLIGLALIGAAAGISIATDGAGAIFIGMGALALGLASAGGLSIITGIAQKICEPRYNFITHISTDRLKYENDILNRLKCKRDLDRNESCYTNISNGQSRIDKSHVLPAYSIPSTASQYQDLDDDNPELQDQVFIPHQQSFNVESYYPESNKKST